MDYFDFLKNKRSKPQTIFGNLLRTGTEVNGVFIPSGNLQSSLNRFAQNLVRFTHDADYKIQLIGSATGLDYRRSKFLVCTMHQIKNIAPVDIGIIELVKSSFISSAGFTCFRGSDRMKESDDQDLCAFYFTEQVAENPVLERRFFKFGSDVVLSDDDEIVAYLAYGCAFSDQRYDVVEDNHLGLKTRSMTCYSGDILSDPALRQCKLISPMKFDPNGLSGGPVFATVVTGTEQALKFAGIINRSGNGTIHFLKAKAIQNLLDLSFD
jgi:hypothetical protein